MSSRLVEELLQSNTLASERIRRLAKLDGASVTRLSPTAKGSISSDSRDGQHSWNLYGNSSSQTIQTTGPFAARANAYFGTEGSPSTKGTSEYVFAEAVEQERMTGTISYTNGKTQNVSGQALSMASSMALLSGKKNGQLTVASGQYYIKLTIKRTRTDDTPFYLAVIPPSPIYDMANVGTHRLSVFNETLGVQLSQQDLQAVADPKNHFIAADAFDLIKVGDTYRAEIVVQLALTNSNDPDGNAVQGGSIFALGILNAVTQNAESQ